MICVALWSFLLFKVIVLLVHFTMSYVFQDWMSDELAYIYGSPVRYPVSYCESIVAEIRSDPSYTVGGSGIKFGYIFWFVFITLAKRAVHYKLQRWFHRGLHGTVFENFQLKMGLVPRHPKSFRRTCLWFLGTTCARFYFNCVIVEDERIFIANHKSQIFGGSLPRNGLFVSSFKPARHVMYHFHPRAVVMERMWLTCKWLAQRCFLRVR